MNEQSPPRRPFHWKGFVSFVLAGLFLLLIVSGGVLYAAPHGRIANRTEWYTLGLDKHAWSILHMAASCLFVIFGSIHLWLNWTSFASYFKMRFERSFNLKREFALALVLLLLLVAAAVWRLPPVSYIDEWKRAIKDHWEASSARPPYPHAEESTLRELTDRLGLDLNVAVERLDREGFTPDTEDVAIADLAASYRVRPDSLYRVIMGEPAIPGEHGRGMGEGRGMGAGSGGAGAGFGRQTIEQLCAQHGVDVDTALSVLKAAGVNAARSDALRDLADQSGLRPRDIADMVAAAAP